MNNVSIETAQFIKCEINDVEWNNIETNLLKIQTQTLQTNFIGANQLMISIGNKFNVYLWNFQTEKQIKQLNQKLRILKIFVSPKSLSQILVGESKYEIIFWSLANGKIFRKIQKNQFLGGNQKIHMSPNFKIFVLNDNYRVNFYRVSDLKNLVAIKQQKVTNVKFSPDSNIIGLKRANSFWRIKDGTQIMLQENLGVINEFEFSPDSQIIAVCLQNQFLCLWNLYQNQSLYKQRQEMGSSFQLSFSPDYQQKLAIFNKQKISLLWIEDWQYENIINSYLELNDQVFFTPNGKNLAFSRENSIFLWRIEDKKMVNIFRVHSEKIENIVFSQNGQFLQAQCEQNGQILIWNTQTSKNFQAEQMPSFFKNILFSNNNNKDLACLDNNNTIYLRQVNSHVITHRLTIENENVNLIAISPNLSIFAKCCQDGQISLHEIKSGQQILLLDKIFEYEIECIKFSPNGRFLACQIFAKKFPQIHSYCQQILVWDVERSLFQTYCLILKINQQLRKRVAKQIIFLILLKGNSQQFLSKIQLIFGKFRIIKQFHHEIISGSKFAAQKFPLIIKLLHLAIQIILFICGI